MDRGGLQLRGQHGGGQDRADHSNTGRRKRVLHRLLHSGAGGGHGDVTQPAENCLAQVRAGLSERRMAQFLERVRRQLVESRPDDNKRAEITQNRAQASQRARQARLDRPASDPECFGHIWLAQVKEVAVGEHQAVGLGQVEQRLEQEGTALLRKRTRLGRCPRD